MYLSLVQTELTSRFGCHTVILYGSRARGDFTPASDYDAVGFREGGSPVREARWEGDAFFDLFVYPDDRLDRPEEFLHLFGGRVLADRDGRGAQLLTRVAELAERPPEPLAQDDARVRLVWFAKMVERARRGDVEGNYRRVWLLFQLLEDYFALRCWRYPGPKLALQSLAAEDALTYELYCAALEQGADLGSLEALVARVVSQSLSIPGAS